MSDSPEFDPRPYIKMLHKGEYLEVKWRLVWLRSKYPNATVATEMVAHNYSATNKAETYAIFRCEIVVPNGPSATGWGMEIQKDFVDYVPKAETAALGRACAALGLGTQFANELDEGERTESATLPPATLPPATKPVDAPIERKASTKQAVPAKPPRPDAKPLLDPRTKQQVTTQNRPVWILGRVECVEVGTGDSRKFSSVYACKAHNQRFELQPDEAVTEWKHQAQEGWCFQEPRAA